MKWRLAKSLETLRAQINAAYPDRDKQSDGTIGDTAHSARTSDHNPNDAGVVCAFDCTNDPDTLPGETLATCLVENQDERIKYIIYNKRMCRSYPANGKAAWVWQPYTGANTHQHHVHISVKAERALYDSTDPWVLPDSEPQEEAPEEPESTAVAEVTTTTTTVNDPPKPSVTTTEEKSSFVTSLTGNEGVKSIASTGLTKVGNRIATGGVSTGLMSAVGAFIDKAWPLLIFAGVLIVLGVVVWLVLYHAKQKEKQIEAQIASDPARQDIKFVK